MRRDSRRGKRERSSEMVSYWQSYSDVMATVLLVFVLILAFTMFESKGAIDKERQELQVEKEKVSAQEEIIKSQQEQIDKIIGVKSDLISVLIKEFENADMDVSIDEQTGSITLDSKLEFERNSDVLTEESKDYLDEFLPVYFKVLLSDKFAPFISEIIFEGHTSISDVYLDSLQLSQSRALSVAKYALKDDSTVVAKKKLKRLREIVTANGRSFSNPVRFPDGSINYTACRRVEIKFRLKDDEMIQEMNEILNLGKK